MLRAVQQRRSRPRIRNSFSRDRRRAPKVAPDPLQEILDRYVDPDRMDVRDCRTVHRLPSSRSRRFAERRPGSIGHITLRGKCAGARSAGKPHAACDVAGAGNGLTVRLVRHSHRKRGETDRPRLRSTAPALDPTIVPARFEDLAVKTRWPEEATDDLLVEFESIRDDQGKTLEIHPPPARLPWVQTTGPWFMAGKPPRERRSGRWNAFL